ncbi:IS1634 family transposase, partial [Streptomyces sp. NPDC059909]|uniref:IS1634 family transposase n=1 Tax=Streptomyces sp. NPDC059909 TaxID=3346998 RepID=UPI003659C99A
RALDAIAPQLAQISGSVGAKAIAEFGIDTTRWHWDMTSISLHGAYEDPDTGYPMVRFGHPKDRRTDLKQIQTGLAVTADGGIPVLHRAISGGAGEVSQVVDTMHALQQLAQRPDFLLLGDSKLLSYDNVAAMNTAGVRFVAPAAAASVDPALYAAQDLTAAVVVEYCAERDQDKPADQRGSYRVVEADAFVWKGRRKSDPPQELRRILVHSSANAAGQKAARDRKLAKAREDLERLQRGLGSHHYPDQATVDARLTAIARARRVGAYLHATTGTGPDGKPALAWSFDQKVIDTEAAVDGWYALLTNLPADQATPAQVLLHYKGQPVIERRYGEFKGPLAVAPMFLRSNKRIAALITVICLALLIFCLIERQIRQALGPQRTMRGFYLEPRAARPTGELILTALSELRIRPGTATSPPTVLITEGIQAQLLDLLDVDPTRPRWLDTRFPTCERRA